MILVTGIEDLKSPTSRAEAAKFVVGLQEKTRSFVVVANNDPGKKLELAFDRSVAVKPPSEAVRKEQMMKYISHFTKEQQEIFIERVKRMSMKDVTRICEEAVKSWSERHQGDESTKPPFRLHMEMLEEWNRN